MKRAICVGINEFPGLNNGANNLRGCVNDADDWAQHLVAVRGYKPHWIVKLTDGMATKSSIIHEVKVGIELAKKGAIDEFFFQLSSHGTQIPDQNGDEKDGMDEAFCCGDLKQVSGQWQGLITDDEWNDLLAQFPANVPAEFMMDTCHSGSALRVLDFDEHAPRPRFVELFNQPSVRAVSKTKAKAKSKEERHQFVKPGDELRILWSGCRPDQTSADAFFNERFNGAFTRGYMECVSEIGIKYSALQTIEAKVQWRESIYKLLIKWMDENEFSQRPWLEWAATDRSRDK